MKTRLLLIIVPLAALAVAVIGGYTLVWRFFVFLLAVLLLSWLWPLLTARRLDSRVTTASDHSRAGEYFEEAFTVWNRGRIPVPLVELEEDTDIPGYENTSAFSLFSRSARTWRTRVYCRRRGRYHIGLLTARVSDPLGFFPRQRRLGESRSIIVYPRTVDLPYFHALPLQEPGSSPRHWLSSELGPDAARVRQYSSGDSLRHIHWRSTAHAGELMVREFDPDRSNYAFKNIWIILDMYRGSQRGEGDESTGEYCVTVAASLVKKYIDSGKRVGLIAGAERPYLFLPEAGDRHLQHILQALALIRADGDMPVEALLAAEMPRFSTSSAVIVITTSDAAGITGPLRRAVGRGATAVVVMLDALSFGGEKGAVDAARGLVSSGIHAYTVRQGQDIARALDNRLIASHTRFIGDRV